MDIETGAELPGRALHQKIVRLVFQAKSSRPQTRIEELARGGGIVRQPVREIGRPVAVIGVDIPDQRFRRTESGPRRIAKAERPASTTRSLQGSLSSVRSLYLRPRLSYPCSQRYHRRTEAENQMRELFEEVAGKSPLDPEEAVRRATRAPRRKRFYARAGVAETAGGFAITLDDKPIRTPSGRQVVVPAGRSPTPSLRSGTRSRR